MNKYHARKTRDLQLINPYICSNIVVSTCLELRLLIKKTSFYFMEGDG